MKRSIIFEETVKIQHLIIVDYDNEDELDEAIEATDHCQSFDDCVDIIGKHLNIHSTTEEYSVDGDGIEYYDDYATPEYEL